MTSSFLRWLPASAGRLCLTSASVLALVITAHAQVIDRVMAVVNGAVITQSDVEAVRRFGLMPPVPVADLVDELINRRLTVAEVNRYAPPQPAAALVDARLADVRRRFRSEEAFARALAEVGLTEDQMRAYVRDDLRIEAYVRQRFGAAYQPPDADILQYYRTRPEAFTRHGVLLSYGEAYDDARAALIAQRRQQQIQDWLTGLRRRADIVVTSGA
jgi:peptidyl-prolyl cis-trans isomerase SurA